MQKLCQIFNSTPNLLFYHNVCLLHVQGSSTVDWTWTWCSK